MKNIVLSLIVSLSFGANILSAFEYEIRQGHLSLGATTDITDLNQFNEECIAYIYYIDKQRRDENGNFIIQLKNINTNISGYEELLEIKKGQGFTVGAYEDCNITINGPIIKHGGYNYKTITSPSGRIWLDRNIGASTVCTKARSEFNSEEEYVESQGDCFGGYYQWGRMTDGHEVETSALITSKLTKMNIFQSTKFVALDDYNSHPDWLGSSNDVNGKLRKKKWKDYENSTICPKGFRVPMIHELQNEGVDMNSFINILKFPHAGNRVSWENGKIRRGSFGSIWSTDLAEPYANNTEYTSKAYNFIVGETEGFMVYMQGRSYGKSVRCIED